MQTDSEKMLSALRIDGSGVPIYIQIREQLLQAIGAGMLRPGDRMPTMRQIAVALKIDLNTARHAYDELERTGAITIVRARGTYVAERQPPTDDAAQAARVAELAQRTIAAAAAAGLDPLDVARHIIDITKPNGADK
jgi:GntR family transcriptional regulator